MSMKNVADDFQRVSIYLPQSKLTANPLRRLFELGRQDDRTLNYMVIKAIEDYLARNEKPEIAS